MFFQENIFASLSVETPHFGKPPPVDSEDIFWLFPKGGRGGGVIFGPKNYLQSIFLYFLGYFFIFGQKLPDNFQNRARGGGGGSTPVWKKENNHPNLRAEASLKYILSSPEKRLTPTDPQTLIKVVEGKNEKFQYRHLNYYK